MPVSMYDISVAVHVQYLTNLKTLLKLAIDCAKEKDFDADVLLSCRLQPDMFPFSRQVQITTDMAKGCAARLAGLTPPSYEDNETTMEELIQRLDNTLTFIQAFSANKINGTEDNEIILKLRSREFKFTGRDYVVGFVTPNFFFHMTTAYNILRHNGVPIGKQDFLGNR